MGILVISGDGSVRQSIELAFGDYPIDHHPGLEATADELEPVPYDYVFLDLEALDRSQGDLGVGDYRRVLGRLWREHGCTQVVVLTAEGRLREAIKAVQAGASSYLTLPPLPGEVRLIRAGLEQERRLQGELDYLRDRFWQVDALDLVRTRSAAMRAVFRKVRQVAQTRTTVLLVGETGTGKNVLARLIHRHSARAEHPFISVHCGALPETLLESELFGHEQGAFTGAIRRSLGRFEIADRGTLFLDEIATIPPPVQVKLLEVLQEPVFRRLGGEDPIHVDVRLVAATNADLASEVAAGRFRKDVYFRLNVFPIELPPLRERAEDLPALVAAFLDRLNRLYRKGIETVHPAVLERFQEYSWPGNVRELESLVERAYVLENGPVLRPESFPQEVVGARNGRGRLQVDTAHPLAAARRRAVYQVEAQYLHEQLSANRGRIDATARAAGISVRQLHKLMIRHGLSRKDFHTGTRGSGR